MADPKHFLLPLRPPVQHAVLPCVVLVHNEVTILPDFLRHYRAIGIDHFYFVDDRSTDGTREFLLAQPDVTVYAPVEGSTYRRDKKFWRAQILDTHCTDSWVVVPDADEHLIFRGIEAGRNLPALVHSLEQEGAEAIHATMLDMYADKSLGEHRHDGGTLIDSFPFFDGPDHYFRMAVSWRTRLGMPTPGAFAFGGMRQRLFEPLPIGVGTTSGALLRKHCDIGGDFAPQGFERWRLTYARLRLRGLVHGLRLYNCSKLPLLKWRRGMMFHGGAHAVNQPLRLSRQRAVLLHFKFATGTEGLRYIANRAQHADGSVLYKRMLNRLDASSSPVFEGSLRYDTSQSLGRLLDLAG